MPGIVQKNGDVFAVGELVFTKDEVGLQSSMSLPCQKNWQGVARMIIKQGEGKELEGLVCLGSDQDLKLMFNNNWWLIAENVESHTKALERTLGFFFA